MKKFGMFRVLATIFLGTLTVVVTALLLMGFSENTNQYCRYMAVSTGAANSTPPKQECFSSLEESQLGVVSAGSQANVRVSFSTLFPKWIEPNFIAPDKPFCAFMLTDSVKRTFNAQCFDSMSELESTTQKW